MGSTQRSRVRSRQIRDKDWSEGRFREGASSKCGHGCGQPSPVQGYQQDSHKSAANRKV